MFVVIAFVSDNFLGVGSQRGRKGYTSRKKR
jgi:hypothetical protein